MEDGDAVGGGAGRVAGPAEAVLRGRVGGGDCIVLPIAEGEQESRWTSAARLALGRAHAAGERAGRRARRAQMGVCARPPSVLRGMIRRRAGELVSCVRLRGTLADAHARLAGGGLMRAALSDLWPLGH